MAKRIIKIFALIVLITAAMALFAIVCLQLFLGTGTAGEMIRNRLNSEIAGQVHWDSQKISVFRGKLSMEAIEVLDPDGQKVITAEGLRVDVGLVDLLSRRVLVQSLSIIRPGIFLEMGPGKDLNFIRAFDTGGKKTKARDKDPAGAPAFNIRVNQLAVENALFSFQSTGHAGSSKTHVFIDDFDINIASADLAQRSGRFHFAADKGRVKAGDINLPVDRLFLKAALAEGRADPLEIEFRSGKSNIEVSGAVSGIFSDPAADIHIDAFADLLQISQILSLEQEFSGNAGLRAKAQGSLKNPEISLELDSDGCRLAGMDFSKILLKARMQNRKLDVSRLEAGLNGGTLEFSGKADLASAFADGFLSPPSDLEATSCSFELKTHGFALQEIPGDRHIPGSLSGKIAGETTGISPASLAADINAELLVKGIRPSESVTPFDAKAQLVTRLEKGVVNLERLEADADDLRISVAGTYDIFEDRLNLNTRARVPELKHLAKRFGVAGVRGKEALLEADISGRAARPVVDARLLADGPGFGPASADSLEAEIGFLKGRLELSSIQLAGKSSIINASGAMQLLDEKTFFLLPDPFLDLTLDTNNMQISDFYPGIEGRLQVNADIKGSLKHPEGKLSADIRDLETGVQTIPEAQLRSVIQGRKINLGSLEIFLTPEKDQALRAKGWVSMGGDYELELNSDPIDLAFINLPENTDMTGQAEISARGSGSLVAPGLDAVIRLSGLEAEDMQFPDMDIRAELKENAASLTIDDPFDVRALYDLAGRDFSVTAQLSDTKLSPFLKAAGLEGFSGALTCRLKAAGNAEDIGNAAAELNVSALELMIQDRQLISVRDFSVFLENNEIRIPKSRIDLLQDGYLDIRGTGGLYSPVDLVLEGSVPARIAGEIFEEIESSTGKIDLSARMEGTVKQPVFSADIAFHDLGAAFASTVQRLDSINGKISLADNKLIVSGINGRLDNGRFSLEGTVDLENHAPVRANFNINARALPVELAGTLELLVNSDLKFSGTPERSALTGDLVVLEGRYFRDVNMSLIQTAGEIGKRRRQTEARAEMTYPDIPFLRSLALDVAIGSRNPFMVDNNLALLSVRPQLTLTGTADNPLLNGRAEVTEGTVTYRNTEFEVQKGVVDFVNPYRIEPEVDIRAISGIRQWTITLSVTGTPENLNFQLTSTPYEEDADILSLLTMGKTTRELTGGSGGGAAPEEMLANLLADQLGKQIKSGTGLDIVEVEYRRNGSESTDDDGVRVTVGKELSRRLTVKYGVERKSGEMVQQSTGIYKLLENLSINAFQDTGGEFGGEMRYRLEFR